MNTIQVLSRILRTPAALALVLVAAAHPAVAEEVYESPPELVVADVLAPQVASGTDHRVADPVRTDGLMHQYSLQSRFGTFEVSGRALLEIRVREIGALAELERVSTSEAFLEAVARSVMAPIETAGEVVQDPVGTITGIPKGIANLFKTYKLKARETADRLETEAEDQKENEAEPEASERERTVARQAQSYAKRHFGVTQAERRWYAKLGVDPYTTNQPLRSAVKKVARVDATAGYGLRFAGVPGIAGMGVVRKGMDAIWREDPVVIRNRNRKFLASIGVDGDERARFENNVALSPTHQLAILTMARELERVDGRGELVRRALDVTSEEEALALIESIGLLVRLHREAPLREILGGIRLPAARTGDGKLVVCAGFDAVYWTENVAAGAREIADAYAGMEASERYVRLAGAASPRVRAELENLGWKLFDHVETERDLSTPTYP